MLKDMKYHKNNFKLCLCFKLQLAFSNIEMRSPKKNNFYSDYHSKDDNVTSSDWRWPVVDVQSVEETSHVEQALTGIIKLQSTHKNAPDYLDGSGWKLKVEQEFFQAPITTWDVHAVRNLLAPKQKREIDWISDHSSCTVHNGKHNSLNNLAVIC